MGSEPRPSGAGGGAGNCHQEKPVGQGMGKRRQARGQVRLKISVYSDGATKRVKVVDASRQGPNSNVQGPGSWPPPSPIWCFSANSGHFSSNFQIICFIRATHFSATNQESVEMM